MTFSDWMQERFGIDQECVRSSGLLAAFEILSSRADSAWRRGARNPLVTVSAKRAGGNSRACTRRMLDQLGLGDDRRRTVHRLLAGAPSGWPGLMALYGNGIRPTATEHAYVVESLAQLTGSPHLGVSSPAANVP